MAAAVEGPTEAEAKATAGEGRRAYGVEETPEYNFKLEQHKALTRSEHEFAGTGITMNDLTRSISRSLDRLVESGEAGPGMTIEGRVRINGNAVEYRAYWRPDIAVIDINTAYIPPR